MMIQSESEGNKIDWKTEKRKWGYHVEGHLQSGNAPPILTARCEARKFPPNLTKLRDDASWTLLDRLQKTMTSDKLKTLFIILTDEIQSNSGNLTRIISKVDREVTLLIIFRD